MMSVTERRSMHLERTASTDPEETHSEYGNRVQKLRIESVLFHACAEETFRDTDITLEYILVYHHYRQCYGVAICVTVCVCVCAVMYSRIVQCYLHNVYTCIRVCEPV